MMTLAALRPATHRDLDALQALAAAALAFEMPDVERRQRLLQRVYSRASLQRAIENVSAPIYVAALPGLLAGMIHFGSPLLEECADRKEIHRLLVHPQHTRRGIGRQLVAAMVRHYHHEPTVRQFFVYVPIADAARAAFYRRAQFTRLAAEDRDGEQYFYRNAR